MGGLCCPPSAENQATAAGLWTLPGDPDEGRAAHHSAEPAPAPPGPVSDAESPGHTATAGQSWRLGPRSWALLVTTVHRRQDRRSREAQQRGGGHELAGGPGKREDLRTQFAEFWKQCPWLVPSPNCGQSQKTTPGCTMPNPRGRKARHKKSH